MVMSKGNGHMISIYLEKYYLGVYQLTLDCREQSRKNLSENCPPVPGIQVLVATVKVLSAVICVVLFFMSVTAVCVD